MGNGVELLNYYAPLKGFSGSILGALVLSIEEGPAFLDIVPRVIFEEPYSASYIALYNK